MKKRILSCLMALALCLTLLPTAALAEGGHQDHCLCGKTHNSNITTHKADDLTAFANAKWMASYTGQLGLNGIYLCILSFHCFYFYQCCLHKRITGFYF